MSKEIAVICRKLSPAEISELKRKELPLYFISIASPSDYPELKDQIKTIPPSTIDHSELHLQRVIAFGHRHWADSSIAEILRSKSVSYWYYLRFSLFQRSRNTFILAGRINELISTLGTKELIHLYTTDTQLHQLIDGPTKVFLQNSEAKGKINTSFLYKYGLLFFQRSIWGVFRNFLKRSKKAPYMIIANPYLVQDVIDPENGKVKKGDPHLQNLIDKVEYDNNFLFLTQLRPPSMEANHKLEFGDYWSSKTYGKRSLYFEPYLLRALFKRERREGVKDIRKAFQKIRALLGQELSSEERVLLQCFNQLEKTLQLAIWRETAAALLFDSLGLRRLIAIDEHSLQNRSLFEMAKQRSITTLAIQHGAISKGNIAYRFVEEDKKYSPWPSLSLIRGNFNRDEMIKNHYPANQLEVVGHMRTDAIPKLKEDKGERSVISYATQPMPPADKALKEKQLSDFLSLCKALKEEKFVIKPHPNEAEIEKYRAMVRSGDYPNLELYEGELYYLLASSKILITYYSTVGLEAVYFNKEVITLDYQKRDFQAYTRSKVAHNVLNGKELMDTCERILHGELATDNQIKEKFIEDRAFKIDAKVTERILASILK